MPSKRLVEHIKTDPFIDIAFVQYLVSREDWLRALERQADRFISIGDFGKDTLTYQRYKSSVREYIINQFKRIYTRTIENLTESLASTKAELAWKSLIVLIASRLLMERIGLGLGEFLPEKYTDLTGVSPIIEKIIEIKLRGIRSTAVIKKALEDLGMDVNELLNLAPLLWWINLVMEGKVFEGIFKFHYVTISKMSVIKSFVKEIESSLLIFRDHRSDYEYMEYEVLKALLSRCAELRGQYINKLQNAILFVKLIRPSISDPARWEWFVFNDILSLTASAYLVEMQRLSNTENIILDVSRVIGAERNPYIPDAGPASVLASLTLLSPIFMQYAIEAHKNAVVTPADIVVAALRLTAEQTRHDDFVVDVQDVAKEVLEFWREKDILRRIEIYTHKEPTIDELLKSRSFSASLALLIRGGIDGLNITTMEKPLLKLPPRMIGYDSLYIRPYRLISIVKKALEV